MTATDGLLEQVRAELSHVPIANAILRHRLQQVLLLLEGAETLREKAESILREMRAVESVTTH